MNGWFGFLTYMRICKALKAYKAEASNEADQFAADVMIIEALNKGLDCLDDVDEDVLSKQFEIADKAGITA